MAADWGLLRACAARGETHGALHGPGLRRQKDVARSRAGAGGETALSHDRRRRRRRDALDGVRRRDADLLARNAAADVCGGAAAALDPAVEPAASRSRGAVPRVE